MPRNGLQLEKDPDKMSMGELRLAVKTSRKMISQLNEANTKLGGQLRWFKSRAYISHTDFYATDSKDTYRWTITFTSSCRTIDNALKQIMNREP